MTKCCGNCACISPIKLYSNNVETADCFLTGGMTERTHVCDYWLPAPRNSRRPVIVAQYYKGIQSGFGFFHQFSQEFMEFEAGPGNYTVAIVEMLDGTVQIVLADKITFINVDRNALKDFNRHINAPDGLTDPDPDEIKRLKQIGLKENK